MKVTKMEGCGNDFVFMDFEDAKDWNLSDLTKKLCNRHFGIGADGAVLVKKHPLEFIYYNSDGSSCSFCGNGMRCFARYCVENKIVDGNEFEVRCGNWIVKCSVQKEEVTVEIPEIIVNKESDGTEIICVCGSRHKVVEVKCLDDAKLIQSDEYNLNSVEWVDEENIRIKTMERGAGLTLACGSGSIASAWKMVYKGKTKEKISVHNPGGTVKVDIKNRTMSGPAHLVFECEWNVNA